MAASETQPEPARARCIATASSTVIMMLAVEAGRTVSLAGNYDQAPLEPEPHFRAFSLVHGHGAE